jgi:hypothetical protein
MARTQVTYTATSKITTFVALDGTVIGQTEEPLLLGRRP